MLKLPEPTLLGNCPAIRLLFVVTVQVGMNSPKPRPVWAASLVITPLTGAGTLLTTLFELQRAHTGMNTRNVLALQVPVNYTRPREQSLPLYREAIRRIAALPGVEQVSVGTLVPWREAGAFFEALFTVEGYAKADGEEDPRARFRTVSPGFFGSLGVPIIAGRDFNAAIGATVNRW